MSNDQRALIEEGREFHRPGRYGSCLACPDYDDQARWPCVAARLADALETVERLGNVAAERMRVAEERADNALAMEASANARAAGWSIDLEAALARLAQAERERDEALTERADLEIGLTLCQDDLTKCGTGLAAARSALEKYGRHHGACPSRPITLTGDWWLDPPEMGACTCGFSVATVGSAPDAG